MATYWAFPPQTFTAWDANGDPVPGAKAYIYEAGTSTPLTVYTDTALTTPHASPIVADANGVFAPIYISGPDEIKINITDASDVTLPGYPVDNITGIPVGGLNASGVVFTPTATLPATNVQTAIATLDTLTQNHEQRLDWLNEVETAGSSDAYTLDASGTVSAYADGQIFVARLDRDNTGAATLNVDGLGAKSWKQHDGSAYVDFAAGELRDGDQHLVEYDSGADEFRSIFIRRRRATQAEAEAGTAVGPYMDPLRTKQAVDTFAPAAIYQELGPYATTSGTSVDVTGITAGAKKIEISFWQVSTTSTVEPEVQIGDSGGIETTGYVSDASDGGGTQSSTTGFIVGRNIAAGSDLSGVLTISRHDGNQWSCAGDISENGVAPSIAGSKALSADLDRLRLTVGGGSFDQGAFSVRVYL